MEGLTDHLAWERKASIPTGSGSALPMLLVHCALAAALQDSWAAPWHIRLRRKINLKCPVVVRFSPRLPAARPPTAHRRKSQHRPIHACPGVSITNIIRASHFNCKISQKYHGVYVTKSTPTSL
ncbi:hypothetical protein B0I37DRAFT_25851 [Chaetomium sp. MPI-CAGE-AT-0009]|nr:hypothetical protein B0I37DRAFT_25851 [Chaetomium sp. MPI-CAGE-AT-0009]